MPNIKFSYLYRDSGNYKNYSFLIFNNPLDIDLLSFKSIIRNNLIDDLWFYVNEWKLPNLKSLFFDNELDPAWHEFESVEYTTELPNTPTNLAELISIIEQTNWYKNKPAQVPKKYRTQRSEDISQLIEQAKELATSLTNYNVVEKGLTDQSVIKKEEIESYREICNVIFQRGVNLKLRR